MTQSKLTLVVVVVVVVVVVFYVVNAVFDPRNLPSKFGQNRVSNR